MAMNAKYMSKLKGKMPPPPDKDDEDGADPVFQVGDDEDDAGAGDVDNGSMNASPDAHEDEKTAARAKDGSLSEEGASEEGSPDHEEREGPHEKAAERKELSKIKSEDMLKELKRRGHPAGDHIDASKGVDENVKPADGDEPESWDA